VDETHFVNRSFHNLYLELRYQPLLIRQIIQKSLQIRIELPPGLITVQTAFVYIEGQLRRDAFNLVRRFVMKSIRTFLVLCVIYLFSAQAAVAQNGAFVVKGQDLFAFWSYNGDGLMAVMSSDSELFCNPDGDLIFADWMEIARPDGSIHYQDRGHYFTRVFFTTPEAFFADVCAGWNNYDLMVAEGIAHSTFNDNDIFAERENARNSWGFTVAGGLYDLVGLCEDDMVELNIVRRWLLKKDFPACEPDCIFKAVFKGPRLNCP
jgi:hypothetical protein